MSTLSDTTADKANVSTPSVDMTKHRWSNFRVLQNVLVVWLDKTIDTNSENHQHHVAQLKRVTHSVDIFTDRDHCIDFVTNNDDKNVYLVVSGALGRTVVPLIHNIPHLHTIFVLCTNKSRHELWAKQWSKIRGVFIDISTICDILQDAAHQHEQSDISISFVPRDNDGSTKVLNRLNPEFMYSQILKEILLTIDFEQKHQEEFVECCREMFKDNSKTLENVRKFVKEYRDRTPIWWYTWDSFLYPMLNHALRTMNVDVIVKAGFFVADLHRHIARLHSAQFLDHSKESFTVYRGQGLSNVDFERLIKTKGGLMSFNNFLSTSTNRNVSLMFLDCQPGDTGQVGVLFAITIDPSKSRALFASVADVGYLGDAESEILFSMHTVFRIQDIQPMIDNQHIFQVNLELTGDDDQDLRGLTDRVREETGPEQEGWARLGILLMQMGHCEKAQQVYEILLSQTTTKREATAYYNQIAKAKCEQGAYHESITLFQESLAIEQESLPPNHPDLASSHNNIGTVYYIMGEYSKALLSYEKTLDIMQRSLPSNHPHLAFSHNNIGTVYSGIGEYSKALLSYVKALDIRQQSLPSNHPDLASSHNNIGTAYSGMGEYSKALLSYEKALEIRQQSIPPNHPDLVSSHNSMGNAYSGMGEYSKALLSYEKALEIRQQSLPSNHPDLASSHNGMGTAYSGMGEYSKALLSYEKALDIMQQSLPSNHPHLASSHNNIGTVYSGMGEYSKALLSYEKALGIMQQSLPSNHPDLASYYNNIGSVHERVGECDQARSFYERALSIAQHCIPLNRSSYQKIRKNLDRVKAKP